MLERLRRAPSVIPDLVTAAIGTCERLYAHPAATRARLTSLVQSGAFVDAALTLIELELPRWKLRRLIFDDGEWHCSLSMQPNLPSEIDDLAYAAHESLPLAILRAFLDAKRADLATGPVPAIPMAQSVPRRAHVICCDNFA